MNDLTLDKMPLGEFLTIDEITDLTGYQNSKSQCNFLRKMGIKFLMNRKGQPKVARAHIRELCCEGQYKKNEKTNFPKVNYAALNELSLQRN